MEINYQFKNGNEYAKVPGTSYRDNGKVRKKGVIYLGRVVNKVSSILATNCIELFCKYMTYSWVASHLKYVPCRCHIYYREIFPFS